MKQKELEKLYRQRIKLEDKIWEKGETLCRVLKLLNLNKRIYILEEEVTNANKFIY